MLQHPGPDLLEITRQIELAEGLGASGRRPQLLAGLGNRHAEHHAPFFVAVPGSLRRTPRPRRRGLGITLRAPLRARVGGLLARRHEGLWPASLASRDLLHAAAG